MSAPHVTIDGALVDVLRLHVPGRGPWWAEADLVEAPAVGVGDRVGIRVGATTLSGTVVASGSSLAQRRVRIVAGAAGWAGLVPARGYHSDAPGGVQARTVADDAARAAGEELGTFAPARARLGTDYVREAGPASRVLEDAIGRDTPWWVDFDGRTQTGPRTSLAADREAYSVLAFDARSRVATLGLDDVAAVGIGSILTEQLDEPMVVRELEFELGTESRARAWCGGVDGSPGRLAGLLEGLVRQVLDELVIGPRLYRVSRVVGDRVELQPVDRAEGLPEIGPLELWPGHAGTHAELALGAEVHVDFVAGRRDRPVVRSFAARGRAGHVPTSTTIDASGASASIKAGASATKTLAYAEDVHAELVKIATALLTGATPGGDVVFATEYQAPLSASAIGTSKTVAE